jgi:hypothetical protein
MKKLLLLPVVAAAVAGSAHAAVIAYDPFSTSDNYSVTAGGDSLGRLPNQSGLTNTVGTGLASTWTTVSGATSNYLYRAAGSLTYPGLATAGNGGIQFTPGDDNFRNARRDTSANIVTADTSNYYASFLLQTGSVVDANGDATVFFGVNNANTTGFGAGISDGSLALQWRDSGGTLQYQSLGTAYTANTTYLFVIKITEGAADWGSSEAQTVWVNPTDFTSDATLTSSALASGTNAATFGVANSNALGGISFQTQNLNGAGVMYADEFRLGTTLADVVPVPEPSTALLLIGSLGSMMALRRRRVA